MYYKGSIYKPVGKRGFLCGAFLPINHPLYSKKIEVLYREIKSGDEFKRHYHKKIDEFVIILEGEYKEKIDGKIITLKAGDFIFLKAKTKTEFIKAKSRIKVICIKTPSIPEQKDKYYY